MSDDPEAWESIDESITRSDLVGGVCARNHAVNPRWSVWLEGPGSDGVAIDKVEARVQAARAVP